MASSPVKCLHCGAMGDFEQRRGVMDTRAATFFGMAWANRGCTEFICSVCGFVHTFADQR